jgi:hypothetical protein
MNQNEANTGDKFRERLDNAQDYAEVWQTVKDTVDFAFGKRRGSMMLFLDDLPLQVGAYHPVGTNNIVLNRRLVEIVEASLSRKHVVNALVYNLLLHEYLHALGELSEVEVQETSRNRCFKMLRRKPRCYDFSAQIALGPAKEHSAWSG